MKNDAAIICPNCGTEMVRARFEIEGGWIRAWLCECNDAQSEDAEMANSISAMEEEVRWGTATFVASVKSVDDKEVKEEAVAF